MRTTPLRVTLAALFGAGILAIGAPLAQAQTHTKAGQGGPPGDNETVKVHRSTTPDHDRRNQPHVCVFYLVGFGFDAHQEVSWHITAWPPTGDRKTVVKSGTLVLDQDGFGRTDDMSLPNGHYKLYWTFNGEHGKAKHKVFWVRCEESTSSPSPTPSSTPTTSKSSTSTPSTPPSNSPSSPSSNAPSSPPSSSPSPTRSAGAPTPVPTKLPVTG